jgi:1,2-diacylglycerol 3-beta-galactosyltransferase
MVPTPIVRDLALGYGLISDQILVTGIPVNPEVVREKRSKNEIRRELGWEQDTPTALAVGSRRVDRLVDTLRVLNHFGQRLQLIVVAGKDEDLFRELKRTEWHVPVKLYEYVHNVPLFMKAADFVVCKAGGLVVTESLACGKPLLLVDVIPGQETGNAEYVIQNGAGDLAPEPIEVLETVAHWMEGGQALLNERAKNASSLGKPNAAYDIAHEVWLAGQRSLAQAQPRGTGRLRLIDLLSRNHVRWEDESSTTRTE